MVITGKCVTVEDTMFLNDDGFVITYNVWTNTNTKFCKIHTRGNHHIPICIL